MTETFLIIISRKVVFAFSRSESQNEASVFWTFWTHCTFGLGIFTPQGTLAIEGQDRGT